MRASKHNQRELTLQALKEFRTATRCDWVRFDFIETCLNIDTMTQAQLKGVEMLLDLALTCMSEA